MKTLAKCFDRRKELDHAEPKLSLSIGGLLGQMSMERGAASCRLPFSKVRLH